MRSSSALILLALLVTFSAGHVLAEDVLNETEAINVTNITVIADVVPVEEAAAPLTENVQASEAAPEAAPKATEAASQAPASRFTQLSDYVKGTATVLGKSTAQGYSDVSQTVSRDAVFTRDAGRFTPALKIGITRVNTVEDKYVQVTNQAVGSWELNGWTLASAGDTTFAFPALTLEEKSSVRVHEGQGASSESDIYTNSSAPLWTDNMVSLQDENGRIISIYDVSTATAAAAWVDPLASQIQY